MTLLRAPRPPAPVGPLLLLLARGPPSLPPLGRAPGCSQGAGPQPPRGSPRTGTSMALLVGQQARCQLSTDSEDPWLQAHPSRHSLLMTRLPDSVLLGSFKTRYSVPNHEDIEPMNKSSASEMGEFCRLLPLSTKEVTRPVIETSENIGEQMSPCPTAAVEIICRKVMNSLEFLLPYVCPQAPT